MATIVWTLTPVLAQITLPTGNTYYFKDSDVRTWIGDGVTGGAEKRLSDAESAIAALSNATHWLGITTTSLSDGDTTNPITINSESVTAVSGDIVQVSASRAEFIFNGTAWQELGTSVGTLKAFAYVDTGTVTLTPSGSNASSAVSGSCAVTPSGTISVGTGTANYTPEGSVSAPAITIASGGAGATTTIKNPTKKTVVTDMSVAAPSSTSATGELVYCSVSSETLTLSKFVETTGDSITTENVTVKTGDATYEATSPSFIGTGAELKFTGSSSSGTINGTAAAQTFTGTEATHTVYPTSSN
jgi:hypothetical protein